MNVFTLKQKDRIRELFRCAVARQTEVMVQNILGSGIDIPLLGLREASREVTGQLHELFTDESYKISQCFLLSTSQVTFSTFRLLRSFTEASLHKHYNACSFSFSFFFFDHKKHSFQSLLHFLFCCF